MKGEPAVVPVCKVVTQYRSAGEMVYELESVGSRLDVRISSVSVAPGGARDWHVTAQLGQSTDAIVIEESAPTKAQALRQVGEVWTTRASELALPVFDWEAVASALLAVRAI